MPTVNIFELDKDLKDRVNTSGDILFLLEECTGWKWQNFKCCSSAKFSPCHCKSKLPALNLNIFELRQRFRKSVEYLWDIGLLLAVCTGWKWQNFKCCSSAKFSPCQFKSKTPAHLKLSTQMPTLHIFELRQRFRKSVEYLWRYRIIAGTVYMLKVAKFQMLLKREVFTLPLQK